MSLSTTEAQLALMMEKMSLSEADVIALLTKMTDNKHGPNGKMKLALDKMKNEAQSIGQELYYPNQEATAKEVAERIINNKQMFFQTVVARTQCGKTGCMIAVIDQCCFIMKTENKIQQDNIYIITGLSSNDWKTQTTERLSFLGGKVYHRNQLKKLAEEIKGKSNVLIIIDEVHIASGYKNTINKMMMELDYKDTDSLEELNINFVAFSATPEAILKGNREWESEGKAKVHLMKTGKGYKGTTELLNGRALQFKKLDGEDEEREGSMKAIQEIKTKIEETYTEPKFHPIRAPKGEGFRVVIDRFAQIFGTEEFDFIECHSQSEKNFATIMRNGASDDTNPNNFPPPLKHTFIFIKENLRCAVTIPSKHNIGILYDRKPYDPKVHVIVQGFAGRACGYDVPEHMIVYTDLKALQAYEDAWTNDFTGKIKQTQISFVDPETFGNPDYTPQKKTKLKHEAFDYKVFTDDTDAIDFIWKHFQKKAQKTRVKARKALQENKQNPTLEYVNSRKFGSHTDIKQFRKVMLIDNTICVQWMPTPCGFVRGQFNSE